MPARCMRTARRSSKRRRRADDDNSDREMPDSPPRDEERSDPEGEDIPVEQSDIRHEYRGGLSVISFLRHSSLLIPHDTPLSLLAKQKITTLLQKMQIRNTHGKIDKTFTFHGLTSDATRDFQVFIEDGDDEEFELKYKLLPYLDMGKTPIGKPIYLPFEWCVIYSKDNKNHERLKSLVSHETPREQPNVDVDNNELALLWKRWRLVFLGQNAPIETLTKLRECIEMKCGESNSKEIMYIRNVKEVEEKLGNIVNGGGGINLSILLCVTEKWDTQLMKAMMRMAELEKGIPTLFYEVESAEHYCDLYVTNLQESMFVRSITQEMIAKTSSRECRDKLLLPHTAILPRFDCNEHNNVMYLGCKVISAFSFPHLTFLVGNISTSGRSTSGYISRVAAGDYMENFPAIFGEMLEKYKEKNDGKSPDRLILFREGFVGGGPIQDIFRKEFDALKERVDCLGRKDRYVRITFIVCRKKGCASCVNVNVGDEKVNYTIFADENAMSSSELVMLVKNLVYSRRYPEPIPIYYTNRAVYLAKAYLEGVKNPAMDKIAQAIDRNLYVCEERQTGQQQNEGAEQERMEE